MEDAVYIEALKQERATWESRGNAEQVKYVDAELRRLGVTRAAKKGTERAVNTPKETR